GWDGGRSPWSKRGPDALVREKVGEVGNRLKHFLDAAPRECLAAVPASRFHERRRPSSVSPMLREPQSLGRCSQLEFGVNDKCTHHGRHAVYASSARIDLAGLRFPY